MKRYKANKVNNDRSISMNSIDGAFIGFEQETTENRQLRTLEKELDIHLDSYDEEIKAEITHILMNLLKYPSSQQAQNHQYANRLGSYDIKTSLKNESATQIELLSDSSKIFCKDCGLAVQSQPIPLCSQFHKFPKVGIAAFLYFQNIKNLMILMFLLAAIYSGYALYIDITEPSSVISFDNFPKKLSFASTVQNLATNSTLYDSMLYQGWLVAGLVLLWWASLFVMKRTALRHERMIDDETITAADFSIMLQHIPVSLTKDQLQAQLEPYYDEISNKKNIHGKYELKPFIIRKFCKAVPFYYLDDESIKEKIKELDEQIAQKRDQIAQLIQQVKENQKFITQSQKRKSMYQIYTKLNHERSREKMKLMELSKKFNYSKNKELKTIAFVTFQHSESANAIEAANPQGMTAKLRYYLSCCTIASYFSLANNDDTHIFRAPQPEDIIWENIGIPDCTVILRKIFTYFVTIVLLGASFGIVYLLTLLQLEQSNAVLSIAISLSITVINIVLGLAIRKLTIYESDITSTGRQTGLAIKSIFAQLMNSILVPIVTNIYIQKNIYEVNGLVYDIFYLSLTSAFLPPILKFIDIPFRIKQISMCFYSNPQQKLGMIQKQLNEVYQLPEFELGVGYIYFIDLYYFTCFYVFVHPCIVAFSLIGFGLMYWAQKHSLLNRSKRPTPSSAMINEAMGQLVAFGPCMLSLGQFVWFNLIREDYHNFSDLTYISHLVALGCSALFFLLPFNALFNVLCSVPDDEDLIYDEVSSHLTTEYDLLNPATSQEVLGKRFSNDFSSPQKSDSNNKLLTTESFELEEKVVDIKTKGNFNKDSQEKRPQIVKIPRHNDQSLDIEKKMPEPNRQIEDFLPDFELENEKFVGKYQPPRARKGRKKIENFVQNNFLMNGSAGYNFSALRKQKITEDNPYKDLHF